MKIDLTKQPSRFRSDVVREAPIGVDRENGVINGYAVISRGEALGHRYWVDGTTLDQVVTLGNAKERGLKSRFTHPGLSSDGLGKYLGKARSFRREVDLVRGDLRFDESAYKTPSGDLATYVMDLADSAPEDFGTSIVFKHDFELEREFIDAHSDEDGNFKSPDKLNVNNYPHVRVKALSCSDVVDEPAANEGGLFSYGPSGDVAQLAEQTLSYVLGLSEAKPDSSAFGVDGERARQFVARYFSRHGLTLKKEEKSMNTEEFASANPEVVESWRKEGADKATKGFSERINLFQREFKGREAFALQCLSEGKTLIESQAALSAVLMQELEAEKAKKPQPAPEAYKKGVLREYNTGFQPAEETSPDLSLLSHEDRAKEEFKTNPALRKEFGNDPSVYARYLQAVEEGKVRGVN